MYFIGKGRVGCNYTHTHYEVLVVSIMKEE